MSDKKRLFLIDAYALIFRGYYAFIKNPRINSKGLDTSAILGFTNSLFDVIKREKPDYMAVCFDKGGSQDRIEIFEDYKANREETPEGIKIINMDKSHTILAYLFLDAKKFEHYYEFFSVLLGGFPEPKTFGKRANRYLKLNNHYDLIIDNQSLSYGMIDIQKRFPFIEIIHHPITFDYKHELASSRKIKYRIFWCWRFRS